MNKKSLIKNISRWIIIFILLISVIIWKKDLLKSAFIEIKNLSFLPVFICFCLSILYQFFEGAIISTISNISFLKGIKCALYCSFYKLATLGTASGMAEVYFLTKSNISFSKSSGITMIQYSIQKIAATVFGLFSFLFLIFLKHKEVLDYKIFILTATIVSVLISFSIILIAASKKLAYLILKLISFIFKNKSETKRKFSLKIINFNKNGRNLLKNKKVLLAVFLLNFLKLSMWFLIPAVIFRSRIVCSIGINTLKMSLAFMISGIMFSPAGVGTLEYVFSLLFATTFDSLTATAIILYRFFTMIVPFILGLPVVLNNKK